MLMRIQKKGNPCMHNKHANSLSYEIKRSLLLGRKVMTNLDSTFKSRDITLLCQQRFV